MKALRIHSLYVLMNLIFVALLLPACGQSGKDSDNPSGTDKPEVDIHAAVMFNNLEVVRDHLATGSDINAKEPFGGSTPLISAAAFGKTKIAKALIDAGADLTSTNKDGSTPLHTAAFFCRVEIVQMLIDASADKTLKNNFGATPRETVQGPFSEIKPLYEMMQQQFEPMGMQLDMAELEKTRPVISMMLQ